MLSRKTLVVSVLVLGSLSGCAQKSPPQRSEEAPAVFVEALNHPPSPAEARIVGDRIDAIFNSVTENNTEYVTSITKLDWGKVYDPNSLNDRKQLQKLIDVNRKALDLSVSSFDKLDRIFTEGLKDLKTMSEKSTFAKAMLFELETRYNQPETGFADLSKELRHVTTSKHTSLEQKLKLLLNAPKEYKFIDAVNVAFQQTLKGKELMTSYQRNMMEHNQMTARQQKIAEMFQQNQRAVVARYKELNRT